MHLRIGLGIFLGGLVGLVGCASSDPASSESDLGEAAKAIDASALITLDPALPFTVVAMHRADGPVLGARWGAHGGPLVTSQNWAAPAEAPKVTRWSFASATDAAKSVELASVNPPNLPAQHFWGSDGLVDLPFGSLAMQAYSGPDDDFSGEVIFYSKDYDAVAGRSHVNGFYSGIGLPGSTRVVYSGLSGLTAAASTTHDSGLWASDVTTLAAGADLASEKLFGWSGSSGPVTADRHGNVFVAAFLSGAAHSDAVFALTKTQSLAHGAQAQATLAEVDSGGTASLAAVADVSGNGWIFGKGYDGDAPAPVYARAYHAANGAIAADGVVVPQAIAPAPNAGSLSVFADDAGDLWVALEGDAASWLIQLAPK